VSIATVVETAVRRHVGARVAAIAAELGADPRRVAREARCEDLGLDSLDLAEMVQIISDRFGVEIVAEDAPRLQTVGDLVALIGDRR
jgi:acyl carrier protein